MTRTRRPRPPGGRGRASRCARLPPAARPRTAPAWIEARCVYLPPATSTKKVSTARWLRDNLPAFAPALLAVAPRRPLRTARALRLALGNARRAARAGTARTAKVQLREFLQAV